jgi:hypothetical protein
MTPCHVNSLGQSTSRSNYGFFHSVWRDFDVLYFSKFWLIFWRVPHPWRVFPLQRFEKWVYLYSVGSSERRILMWRPVWKNWALSFDFHNVRRKVDARLTRAHTTRQRRPDRLPHTLCILYTTTVLWVTSHVNYVAVCCSKRRVLESISKTSSLFYFLEMRGKFTEITRNFSSVLGTVVIVPSYSKIHEFVSPAMMMRRCLLPYMRPRWECVADTGSFFHAQWATPLEVHCCKWTCFHGRALLCHIRSAAVKVMALQTQPAARPACPRGW